MGINNLRDAEVEIKKLQRTIHEMATELRRLLPAETETPSQITQTQSPLVQTTVDQSRLVIKQPIDTGSESATGSGGPIGIVDSDSQIHIGSVADSSGAYFTAVNDNLAITVGARWDGSQFIATGGGACSKLQFDATGFTISFATGTPGSPVAFSTFALRIAPGGVVNIQNLTASNYVKTNPAKDLVSSAT